MAGRFFMRALPGVLLVVTVSASAADNGVRFDSPGVVDLAAYAQQLHGEEIAASALDGQTAKQILGAPALDQEHATLPFSDYAFGCAADSKTCVPQHESRLITASNGAVKRDKRRLSIKPTEAAPVVFVDWKEPTTKTADGDGETHWYLGMLPENGLHQVEVQFEHDAPGSFLINAKSGKAAFVHSGSDIAVVSPDGMRLLTFNPDGSGLTLRVAALDAGGPRTELECMAGASGARPDLVFKGWNGAGTFDLAIAAGAQGGTLALRFAHATAWHLAASDVAGLRKIGLVCRQ